MWAPWVSAFIHLIICSFSVAALKETTLSYLLLNHRRWIHIVNTYAEELLAASAIWKKLPCYVWDETDATFWSTNNTQGIFAVISKLWNLKKNTLKMVASVALGPVLSSHSS